MAINFPMGPGVVLPVRPSGFARTGPFPRPQDPFRSQRPGKQKTRGQTERDVHIRDWVLSRVPEGLEGVDRDRWISTAIAAVKARKPGNHKTPKLPKVRIDPVTGEAVRTTSSSREAPATAAEAYNPQPDVYMAPKKKGLPQWYNNEPEEIVPVVPSYGGVVPITPVPPVVTSAPVGGYWSRRRNPVGLKTW